MKIDPVTRLDPAINGFPVTAADRWSRYVCFFEEDEGLVYNL